jgi:hypothetical protein
MSELYALRVFKFVYQILSLALFGTGVLLFLKRYFPVQKKYNALIFLTILISGFSNYDYLPQTLSYNSWSLILSLVFWFGLLTTLALREHRYRYFMNILIGFTLFLLLYAKLPNAVFLGFFYVLTNVLFLRKQIIINLLCGLAGALIGLFFLFHSFDFFYTSTLGILNDISGSDHASMSLYVEQFKDYFRNIIGYRLLIYEFIALVILIILRRWYMLKMMWMLGVILWNAYYSCQFFSGNSSMITNDFNFIAFFLINGIFVTAAFWNQKISSRYEILFIILILLATPFALAIGTNNPIFYTLSHSLVYVVAAVYALGYLIPGNFVIYYFNLYAIFISFFIISILTQGFYRTPYRQTALGKKNLPLFFSERLHTIKEDEKRFGFLYSLYYKMKKNNSDNDPVSATLAYVGSEYISRSEVFPLFSLPNPHYSMKSVRDILANTDFKGKKLFMVISQADVKKAEFVDELKKNHVDLKNDYLLCDSLYAPDNSEYIYFYKAK